MSVKINPVVGGVSSDNTACRTVLLVDDEVRILNALDRLLRERYDVVRTTSPREALEMLEAQEFALLISDQRMPEMLGSELCAKAAEASPETIRVMLTGYSDLNSAMESINRGSVFRFILKPWNDEELRKLVRKAVDQYNLVAENRRLQALTERQNTELQDLNEQLKDFNAKLREKVFERTRQVSELNQKVTNHFKGSIDLLARLSNMHSQVLGNHSKRVADLSLRVGRARGISQEILQDLEIAGTLHDIGKIGMDPGIVGRESGELSTRDKAVLRTHPVTAAALIQRIPELERAALMVRHHHEAFDGSGYPDKLRGDTIPLGARIIAVVDAFDNFLNMRSRFTLVEAESALEHLEEQAGTRFDPRLVQLLVSIIHEDESLIPEASEVEIALRDLRSGMVLSRDLISSKGLLLLQKGIKVDEKHLPRLLKLNESDPIVEGPYIYRRSAKAAT